MASTHRNAGEGLATRLRFPTAAGQEDAVLMLPAPLFATGKQRCSNQLQGDWEAAAKVCDNCRGGHVTGGPSLPQGWLGFPAGLCGIRIHGSADSDLNGDCHEHV